MKYLKERFGNREVSVRHHACKGGSYRDILQTALQRMGNDSYDTRLLVWDTDRAQTHEDQMPPNSRDMTVIPLSPCVEGVLLELLGQPVPQRSKACKSALEKIVRLDHIEKMRQALAKVPDAYLENHDRIAKIIRAIKTGTIPAYLASKVAREHGVDSKARTYSPIGESPVASAPRGLRKRSPYLRPA
ncbi:MAG: hypothetical protein LBK99_05045 [Opitutaceae bacterium]|nr:hypothetical protein [Opitutaceae bacterium]